MLMGKFFGDETMRARKAAGLPTSLPCPSDFRETFVRIGRIACEEHYRVGRHTVNRWLEECGKDRLIAERSALVFQRDFDRRDRLTRQELARALSHAFPVQDHRFVDPEVAAAAAHFLRAKRNGGWIVSRTLDGDWLVGLRRRSSADLLDMAIGKGFDPASVTGGGE